MHVQGQVHRSVRGHQSQRRRAAGGNPHANQTEAGRRRRGTRPLVQKPKLPEGQPQGQTDVHVGVWQGGHKNEKLRKPPSPLDGVSANTNNNIILL